MPPDSGLLNKFIDFEALSQEQARYVKSWEEAFAKTAAKAAASVYSAGTAVNNSSGTGDQVAKEKALSTAIKDAEEALKKKNAEMEKGFALIEKQQAKAKENTEKQQQKEIEAAIKSRNTESAKALAAIQKEIDYLKKHGEETVKLTRNVADLKVKYSEVIAKEQEHTKAGQAIAKEYQEQNTKLTELHKKLGDHTDDVGRYGKVWDALKSSWIAVAGAMAAAAGAFKITKDIIESTGKTADEFRAVVGGLKESWHQFMGAIATGDFSNLSVKMREAYEEGKRYIETLDQIRDATRAISVKQSEYNLQLEQLKTIQRTVSQSKEVRLQAGNDALVLENKLLAENLLLAEKSFKNEMDHAKQRTGLGEATIKSVIKGQDPNDPNYAKYEGAKKYLEIQEKIRTSEKAQGNGPTSQFHKELIQGYNDELAKIPKIARDAAPVMQKMMVLTAEDGQSEVAKLTGSWSNLYNVQARNETERRRIVITQGRLNKGILDEGIKEEKEAAKELLKTTKDKKDAIQVLDDAIAKCNSLLIDQAAAGNVAAKSTANQIALLQAHKRALDELIWALKNPELQKDLQPGFHAPQKTAVKVDTGAPTLDKPEKVSNPIPDFTKEPVSQEDIVAEKERKAWEKRLEITKQFVNAIQNVVNQLYDSQLRQIDDEKQAVDDRYQKEYDAAAGNSSKQREIKKRQAKEDAELDKQKRKILHDQAVLNKALGAVQIVVNTAVAAVAQMSVPVGGIALAAVVIALGAIELALVLAQPVPALKKGRKGGPATFAKVSEEGQEGVLHKGKLSLLPERESIAYIPAGASVIPHNELMDMAGRASLGGVQMWPAISGSKQDNSELVGEIRDLKDAVKNKKEVHLNFDKHGFSAAAHSGAVWEKYLNDHIRL